jgi:hypothetical protein
MLQFSFFSTHIPNLSNQNKVFIWYSVLIGCFSCTSTNSYSKPVPVHVWDLVVPTLCSPTPRITIKQGGTKTVSMNNLISSFVYFPVEMGGRSSHVSWIYIYLCNRYISPFSLWVETPIQWQVVLQSRFCDMWQIGVFLRTFFSTKTTDRHRVLHSYVLCMYHVYSHSTHWLVNNLLLSIDEYLILLNFIIICK